MRLGDGYVAVPGRRFGDSDPELVRGAREHIGPTG